MSILTDLIEKKITFSQAATQIGTWITNIAQTNPTLAAGIAQVESDTKQLASNAIAMGETELATVVLPFIKTLEPGMDAALVAYAGPLGNLAVPAANDTVNAIANAVIAEVQAWQVKAQAGLTLPPPQK